MNRNKRKKNEKTVAKKHVNRNYKDSLFCMIFGSREAALELYNAVNHSHYQNSDELEITTIEGALYMGFPCRSMLYFIMGQQRNRTVRNTG